MIEITGINKALSKAKKLRSHILTFRDKALEDTADDIIDAADKVLDGQEGTGVWGGELSHDSGEDSIYDSWNKELMGDGSVDIKNTSPHAAPVEFGSHGPITPNKAPCLRLSKNLCVSRVEGQRGYHYLENSLYNNFDTWIDKLSENIRKRINTILV